MDWEDYGFEKVTSRSRAVECIICGRHGAGIPVFGIAAQLFKQEGLLNRWQLGCMKPHIYECACGKVYPKLQSLANHCAQNRRHHIPGQGSLERVGWGAHQELRRTTIMDIVEAAIRDAKEQVDIQSAATYIQPWEVTSDGIARHEVTIVEPHRVFYQVQQLKKDGSYRAVGKPTQEYPRALASAQTRATRSGRNHRIIEFVVKAPSPSEDTTGEEMAP